MKTYERTREHGTVETVAGNGKDRMAAIRAVVDNCQYAKIDGVMMDLFTASAICQVYDALSDSNKAKYEKHQAARMGVIALQLIS